MLLHMKACWGSHEYESLASLRAFLACSWLPLSFRACVVLAPGLCFFKSVQHRFSGPGQFLGHKVLNRVLTIRLGRRLTLSLCLSELLLATVL